MYELRHINGVNTMTADGAKRERLLKSGKWVDVNNEPMKEVIDFQKENAPVLPSEIEQVVRTCQKGCIEPEGVEFTQPEEQPTGLPEEKPEELPEEPVKKAPVKRKPQTRRKKK